MKNHREKTPENVKKNAFPVKQNPVSRDEKPDCREEFREGQKCPIFTDSSESFPRTDAGKQIMRVAASAARSHENHG